MTWSRRTFLLVWDSKPIVNVVKEEFKLTFLVIDSSLSPLPPPKFLQQITLTRQNNLYTLVSVAHYTFRIHSRFLSIAYWFDRWIFARIVIPINHTISERNWSRSYKNSNANEQKWNTWISHEREIEIATAAAAWTNAEFQQTLTSQLASQHPVCCSIIWKVCCDGKWAFEEETWHAGSDDEIERVHIAGETAFWTFVKKMEEMFFILAELSFTGPTVSIASWPWCN